MKHPVIGELREFAGFAESKFKQFESSVGIHGLGFVSGSRLELLMVMAPPNIRGCFRAFMNECKAGYSEIRVWCVMNPAVETILTRYGFTKGFDMDQYGEMQDVWDWAKSVSNPVFEQADDLKLS